MSAATMRRSGSRKCRRHGAPNPVEVVFGFVFAVLLGAVGVDGNAIEIKPKLNGWSTLTDEKKNDYLLICDSDPKKYLFINSLVWTDQKTTHEVMGKANFGCSTNRNGCRVDFKSPHFTPNTTFPESAKRIMSVSCMDHERLTAVAFNGEMQLKCREGETLRIQNATLIKQWTELQDMTQKVIKQCEHKQNCSFRVDAAFTGVSVDATEDASLFVAYDCEDVCSGYDCGPYASCHIEYNKPRCKCQFGKSAVWGKQCKALECLGMPCTPYGDCQQNKEGYECKCEKFFKDVKGQCEYQPHLPCMRSRETDTCPPNALCHHAGIGATGAQCVCPPGHFLHNNKCEKGAPVAV